MWQVTSFVMNFFMGAFRSRLSLQLEIAALRHQLSLYQRKQQRPVISSGDRMVWVVLAHLWRGWRKALYFVQPRTVILWQRKRFRDYWRELSRRGHTGRSPISPELRCLIRRMWNANPTWGSPRIVGELQMLGIDIAKSTVERYRPKSRKPPSPSWRTFLEQHMRDTAAIDFFTVPATRFRVLFVLVVLCHDRRRIVHFNVTEHPTAEWTAQQLVEAFPWELPQKYLLRDCDAIFGAHFRKRVHNLGLGERPIAPRSPWQNPYVERLIGSIRRECLDHHVVLNERHLKRLLHGYFAYYHRWRLHRSLEMDSPDGRPVHSPEIGKIIELPAVGGLHHTYIRKTA